MYTVSYRCLYRDWWYDVADCDDLEQALGVASRQERNGRTVRITGPDGIIYQTYAY